jgi:methylenetetrahydrofolate reductase (NADPH)
VSGSADPFATLALARYEVLPLPGVDAALAHLPDGIEVAVTASHADGMGPTVQLAGKLAALGHRPVPHLCGRSISGPGELDDLVGALRGHGVEEVLVLAGAGSPAVGPYPDALSLLEALTERGAPFPRMGVAGFPEGHPFRRGDAQFEDLARKAAFADHVVTQVCTDPGRVRRWIARVREHGIDLAIRVGIPGVVQRTRLPGLALRLGALDALRYARSQPSLAATLLRGDEPDRLVRGLAPLLERPQTRVIGWHVCTFNQVERTERWRRERLGR